MCSGLPQIIMAHPGFLVVGVVDVDEDHCDEQHYSNTNAYYNGHVILCVKRNKYMSKSAI